MKNTSRLCLAVLALAATVGCLRMPAGISPSNTPLGTRSYKVLGDAFGSDTHVALLDHEPWAKDCLPT